MLNTKQLKSMLGDYPYIAAAYLFGSHAQGRAGPMSDVDIAILLRKNAPRGRHLLHEEDYIAYRASRILSVKQVDIISLNGQGLVFQHNVLRTGRLFYDVDPLFRVRFEMAVISEFCDFEPTLRFMEKFHIQGRLRRIAEL